MKRGLMVVLGLLPENEGLLVFASPAIWPLCITGAAGEIGCGNPALLLPASLVWCLLALAWLLGKKLRSKTR